ncbi:Septum formation initiator [Marinomonas sp. MED121]|nr:Septum formation initiator [Marinomonas sp. MED121]
MMMSMQRIVSVLFAGMAIYLAYQLVYGEQGRKRQEELSKQVEFQELTNDKLSQRNAALRAQLSNLRNGQDAVEEKIRIELQYIKEGETFYRMVDQ